MSDWIKLDKQWRQRSEQLFQRCIKESDLTKAQIAWYAACQSEERRLEWKCLCLQQEEKLGASAAVESERSLFILEPQSIAEIEAQKSYRK